MHSGHSAQGNPETIEEIRRILLLHLQERVSRWRTAGPAGSTACIAWCWPRRSRRISVSVVGSSQYRSRSGSGIGSAPFVAAAGLRSRSSAVPLTSAGEIATALVVLHVATPGRPYGSWGARDRADPGSGWWLPARLQLAARALLALGAVLVAAGRIESPGRCGFLSRCSRSIPPGYRRSAKARRLRLFYDGECGLCHAAVRFVLAEDRDGQGFRFAPLASESFARLAPAELRATLPDSLC